MNIGKQPSAITGMDAMGKPISSTRREEANKHLKEMGVTGSLDRFNCIKGVAEKLEQDKPHEAMTFGMQYLDAIGVYRLFAVLLTEPQVKG